MHCFFCGLSKILYSLESKYNLASWKIHIQKLSLLKVTNWCEVYAVIITIYFFQEAQLGVEYINQQNIWPKIDWPWPIQLLHTVLLLRFLMHAFMIKIWSRGKSTKNYGTDKNADKVATKTKKLTVKNKTTTGKTNHI